MQIKLSKNINDVTIEMGAMPSEILGKEMSASVLAKLIRSANKAAHAVWKKHPEFKTVTLDTFSQEEKNMMETVEKVQKGGS